MSRIVPGSISRLNLLWLTLALGGCAVVGSAPTFTDEPGVSLGCTSTLGSYSLPKTVLTFKITKKASDYLLKDVGADRVPDNQHTFCLDHLRSALASDEVRVFKNKITVTEGLPKAENGLTAPEKRRVTNISYDSTPYLQLIASKAVDNTAGIVRRIIRTAFILFTNKGSFSGGRSSLLLVDNAETVVADFQVDPFDFQEMARVNDSVRRFGFCFVLEDYTFDRYGASVDRYCQAPQQTARDRPPSSAEALQRLHYLVPKPVAGIYFRPRAAYRLSIYTKDDPGGRRPWRLTYAKNLKMENVMPIVSVGVARAVFATRRTGLVFDDGTLTNVCISKGSEIEGGIQIPLDVIYGIVALPSEMLLAAINDTTTSKDLLAAQKRLIDAQNHYIRFLNKQQNPTALESKTGATLTLDSPVPVPGTTPNPNTVAAANNVGFEDDDPPDAGPIAGGTTPDALSEICAELSQTKTTNKIGGGTNF